MADFIVLPSEKHGEVRINVSAIHRYFDDGKMVRVELQGGHVETTYTVTQIDGLLRSVGSRVYTGPGS